MYNITICSNDETICEGYTDELTEAWTAEIAAAYVYAAIQAICTSEAGRGAEFDTDSNFSNWHGGRHHRAACIFAGIQFGYKIGLIVTHEENPAQWLRDLCDKANQAGADARYKAVEEYEAIAAA